MRIRNIKPGFWQNELLGQLDFHERLLFIGLWNLADSEGRLEDRPERIRAALFAYDDPTAVPVDQMLDSLATEFITRYEVNGRKYIQINTFQKHQALSTYERKQKSDIPPPEALQKNFSSASAELPKDTRRTSATQQPDEGRMTKDIEDYTPPVDAFPDWEKRSGSAGKTVWEKLAAKFAEAHPCCGGVSEIRTIATLRIYEGTLTEAQLDRAVDAFARHMSGAESAPRPLGLLEKYLKKEAKEPEEEPGKARKFYRVEDAEEDGDEEKGLEDVVNQVEGKT